MVTRGRTSAQASAGRRGRRPLRFAGNGRQREPAPHPALRGHLPPRGEGKGCCWRQRKPPRGVGDAAPYGLPGMGGSGSLPLIRPCGATFPQGGKARAVVGGSASLRGASGTPPPTVCREWAAAGACPSSGPAGPPSPKGEGKGCCWRRREPAPTPAAGPRCGAGGSGCSTSGLTKPALYRRNLGRCRGGSRR